MGRNINGRTYEEMYADTIDKITSDTVCLSVGGDVYCYPNWQRYAAVHYAALRKGAKSILWSCSIEPSMIDYELLEVLRTHHMIAARESVTANELKKRGLTNVIQTADIAFTLKSIKTDTPPDKYAVLNLSPLVIRKNPNVLTAYQYLADKIIKDTELNIALVPHVEVSVDNDIDALNMLKGPEDRLFRIPTGLSAAEYKYIISKSECCAAARTHATIAAWSSLVPTVAVGYSAKAKGISSDLGQEKYLLGIDDLSCESLSETFFRMIEKSEVIKNVLAEKIPLCVKKAVSDEAVSLL